MQLSKNKLSARGLASAATPGMYGDGDGLYLRVNKTKDGGAGSRQWVLVYHRFGKRREAGLGGFPRVGLTEARLKRDTARAALAAGRSPTDPAAKPGGRAFGKVAVALIADIEGSFKNERHRSQWRESLEVHAKPIWDMPVDQVDTDAVLQCLSPIWGRIPETADRVRGRIERVLDAARVRGLRPAGDNPARWKGHLALILPAQKKTPRPHPAMPYEQVAGFLAELRVRDELAARMLELTVLTASRTNEVVGARRREVDLDLELWIVPAERMKAGREHRVPLVGRAAEIMRELCEGRGPGDYLFPGQRRGRPLSNMAMAMLLRRMDVKFTVHGFRSSFRDWAGDETDFPEVLAEQALAHAIGSKTQRAYRRSDALDKRRALMEAWDAYCATATIKLAVELAFGRKPLANAVREAISA